MTTAPTITTIYAKFGIPASATAEQIVQAYLRLATKLQATATGQDEKAKAQFQSLANAYFVLSDRAEKRRYDQYIAEAPSENFKLSQRPPAADILFEQAASLRATQLAARHTDIADLAGALMADGLPVGLAHSLAEKHVSLDLSDFGIELTPTAKPNQLHTPQPNSAPQTSSIPKDLRGWQQPAQEPSVISGSQATIQPYAPPLGMNHDRLQNAAEVVYAGFWERFAASIIDGLVLLVAQIIIGAVAMVALRAPAFAQLMNIVMGMLYFGLQESSWHRATLGKRAIGLQVTTSDGGQLSVGRGIGRYFARWISGFMLLIGYLIQPFTEKRQALHDMITDTIVVRDPTRKPAPVLVILIAAIVPVIVIFGILAAIAIPQFASYQTKAHIKAGQADGRNALITLITDRDGGSQPYPEHRSFPHSAGVESVEFDANQQAVVVKFATPDLNKTPLRVYTIRNGAQTCFMLDGQKANGINTCPENAASDLHN